MNAISRPAKAAQAWRTLRRDGPRGLGTRLVRVGYHRLGAGALEFPLLPGDIADSTRLVCDEPAVRPKRGTPLVIGWLTTPPSLGSGGHTTMFRMVEALEAAGHTCVLYLYDRFGGDLTRHTAIIREGWPTLRALVRDVADGIGHVDGMVATSWPTAHVLAARSALVTRRFYFVQDFEPFFYPRGSEFVLAEDSYRFGFTCIAIGHMVADLLAEQVGVRADVAEFGCDTDVYRLANTGGRSGVVFYTKPDVARRGYLLGVLALEEFHRRHPEHEIHVFGDPPTSLPFPVTRHDNLTPSELNALYNATIGGLAMSFTNISLVAEEMLAAGAIPVVNDSAYSRADLRSRSVVWAQATPGALADALSGVVSSRDVVGQAAAASLDVRKSNWAPAQGVVVNAIEQDIFG